MPQQLTYILTIICEKPYTSDTPEDRLTVANATRQVLWLEKFVVVDAAAETAFGVVGEPALRIHFINWGKII